MSMEQTDQRPRVFISYSRVDSEFAYRLRADLEASGFATWIDTAKLGAEGGQEWMRIIQDAVDSCQAMVVVLSPDSVQSKYVHMEYHRAQSKSKLVVPLHYRTVTSAPIDLDLAQWLEFREDQRGSDTYQTGLTNLIRSLAKAPQPPKLAPLPQAPTASAAPLTISEGADMPEFRPVSPAPPEPSPDTLEIIAAVFDARGRGDLVSEEYFLHKVVESRDSRVGPDYAERLKVVASQLEQQRVERLRKLAVEAVAAKQWRRALGAWQALESTLPGDPDVHRGIHQARIERAQEAMRDHEYDEAIGSWQALLSIERTVRSRSIVRNGLGEALKARAENAWNTADWVRAAESWETLRSLTPPEPNAQEFLNAIDQNRREAYRYQTAERLLVSGNMSGARAALEDLYKVAPFYGDPSGIAPQVNVQIGKSLASILREKQTAALAAAPGYGKMVSTASPASASGTGRRAAIGHSSRRTAATTVRQTQPKSKAEVENGSVLNYQMLWSFVASYYGPANLIGTAVAAAVSTGNWWTLTMLFNSIKLAWMSVLLCMGLLAICQITAVILGIMPFVPSYRVRRNAAMFFGVALTIPGCWLIALWLVTGFRGGINWLIMGILASAGVGSFVVSIIIFLILMSISDDIAFGLMVFLFDITAFLD
jgi:tetratricopeptide (TPR) repeat protein